MWSCLWYLVYQGFIFISKCKIRGKSPIWENAENTFFPNSTPNTRDNVNDNIQIATHNMTPMHLMDLKEWIKISKKIIVDDKIIAKIIDKDKGTQGGHVNTVMNSIRTASSISISLSVARTK